MLWALERVPMKQKMEPPPPHPHTLQVGTSRGAHCPSHAAGAASTSWIGEGGARPGAPRGLGTPPRSSHGETAPPGQRPPPAWGRLPGARVVTGGTGTACDNWSR